METMIYCELCSRYGVKTPVTGEITRELEGEGVTKVYEFPVCPPSLPFRVAQKRSCADMLDNDTRTNHDCEANLDYCNSKWAYGAITDYAVGPLLWPWAKRHQDSIILVFTLENFFKTGIHFIVES